MTAVEYWRPGTPPVDDPRVVEAMTVYDEHLNDAERREVFRSTYRAVLAFSRTQDVDHLTQLLWGLSEMVVLESQPGFTESRRTPSKRSADPGDGMGMAEVARRLRGELPS